MKRAVQMRVDTKKSGGQLYFQKKDRFLSLEDTKPQDVRLSVKTQDEAIVVSAEFYFKGEREKISQILSRGMEQMAKRVQDAGGIVGHIKASVDFQETAVFSVTLDHADIRKGAGCEAGGKFAAIILLLDEMTAYALAEQMFTEIRESLRI